MPGKPKKVFSQPDADLLSRTQLRHSSDLLSFLVACQKQLGDYVHIDDVAGLQMYLLTDPASVQHVFVTAQDNYVKPAAYAVEMGRLMGSGLLTSEGPDWLRQRRISQPIFHAQQMPALLHVVSSCTANLLESWQSVKSQQWIDFYKEMLHLTNAISVELMFGSDDDNEGLNIKAELADTLFKLKVFAQEHNEKDRSADLVDRFHNLVIELISRRRLAAHTGGDLLSYYMTAGDGFGQRECTEQKLIDEVKTLTIGGHHNLAAALSWSFYLLALNKDVQKELCRELDASASTQSPSVSELGKLVYLRAILQETMRLYPPVWGTTRESINSDNINGYEIPAGSMVFLCQWITQRHPHYWAHPDKFDPDRFSDEKAASINKFAYFPFGKGPRQCIAQDLSVMSMLLIASEVGRRYQFDIPDGWTAAIDPAFVLAPKGGLPMRLHPRN